MEFFYNLDFMIYTLLKQAEFDRFDIVKKFSWTFACQAP